MSELHEAAKRAGLVIIQRDSKLPSAVSPGLIATVMELVDGSVKVTLTTGNEIWAEGPLVKVLNALAPSEGPYR